MKFSVFVAGGRDRWDPRDDRPSAKCHAMMMMMTMMTMTMTMMMMVVTMMMIMMMMLP